MRKYKYIYIVVVFTLAIILLNGCNSTKTSGDAIYEANVITIEGLDGGTSELTIEELRALEQISLDASFQRTTGTQENYKMQGPTLKDIVALAGGNISDYEGIGVVGSDGYYCLVPKDIIEATPDLMLALVIDGKARLDESVAPAMLGIQGQYGPYWVKKVDKLILYKDIPRKDIKSVWVFDNLIDGIEPYNYEYYGSKDKAIELIQIFSRFDSFDSQAFFTMKSSDGFKKNEVMNMIKPQYYIKIEGEDAPTNIAPYIKLGMNVKNIAWFSTNEDAVVFPYQLETYIEQRTIDGCTGLPLSEILYELEFESIKNNSFELIDTDGNKTLIQGVSLVDAILVSNNDKTYSVLFDPNLGIENIDNLMRIRVVQELDNPEDTEKTEEGKHIEGKKETGSAIENKELGSEDEPSKGEKGEESSIKIEDYDLVISLDGKSKGYMLDELKSMTDMYTESVYSSTNNYPVRKDYVAKGIDLSKLLKSTGMDKGVKSVTVKAKDGYSCKFTYEQLFNTYYYPNAKDLNISNKIEVPTILAFKSSKDTTNLEDASECNLKLFIGQRGINEPNTIAMVDNVVSIELSSEYLGKWDSVISDIPSSTVEKGTKINLMHDYMDNVKIYYTLDGSEPNYNSLIYNPSTSYFQPELTLPITINETVTIKAIAIGYGKANSDVVTFEFSVE